MEINNLWFVKDFMLLHETDCNDYYYKFELLVRKKDGFNGALGDSKDNIKVKTWYVKSYEQFDKVKSEMIYLAEVTGGRLYMVTDRKSMLKTLSNMQSDITNRLIAHCNGDTCAVQSFHKITDSISSKDISSTHKGKGLMFDVDTTNQAVVNGLVHYLKTKTTIFWALKTVNGYHVITYKNFKLDADWKLQVGDFVINEFKNTKHDIEDVQEAVRLVHEIQCKANQLTLLYYKR